MSNASLVKLAELVVNAGNQRRRTYDPVTVGPEAFELAQLGLLFEKYKPTIAMEPMLPELDSDEPEDLDEPEDPEDLDEPEDEDEAPAP